MSIPKHPFKLLSQADYHGHKLEVLQKILRLSSRKFTRAFIRQDKLAAMCKLTVRGLQKILTQLKADGVLMYNDGSGTIKEYCLNYDKLTERAKMSDPTFNDLEELVAATEMPKNVFTKEGVPKPTSPGPVPTSQDANSKSHLDNLRSRGFRVIGGD